MVEPNKDDPLMPKVVDQVRYHKDQYLYMAKKWTNKYAGGILEGVVVDSKNRNASEGQGTARMLKNAKPLGY